jgi:hypothetical protein
VFEWNEEMVGGFGGLPRGIRGGSWGNVASDLAASDPIGGVPAGGNDVIGFRVASPIPSPARGCS